MPNLSDRLPIPPKDQMNSGLSPALESTMLEILKRPGDLTPHCSDPTGDFRSRVVTRDVGPFRVTGYDVAVASLAEIFAEVKAELPEVYAAVKNEGMLCVRHRRHNPSRYSNHSWGCAIDIYFGTGVVDQGEARTHRGNLLLAPYFNRHGWYWGAEFSGDSVDSMHFELSEESIRKIGEQGRLSDGSGNSGAIEGGEDEAQGPLVQPPLSTNADLQKAARSLRPPFARSADRREAVGIIQDVLDRVLPEGDRIRAGANRGIFGPLTEKAVRAFQTAAGIGVDGQVGRNTLRALDRALASPGTPVVTPVSPTTPASGGSLSAILDLAAASDIARYHWNDRGRAPLGYTKGMALVFGRAYCKLRSGDLFAIEMARADKQAPGIDALAYYRAQFHAVGMDNSTDGVDTLRHLFVLMLGLGMRESSGAYCEGRDVSNPNSTTSDTAEAGLFQTSWNAHEASLLLPQLYQAYQAHPNTGFIEVFREQVTCSPSDWVNYGSGTGAAFQELSKKCPAFAAEFAAVALRNVRNHWGPINTRRAEIRPEADAMFLQVQHAIDGSPLCPLLI